MKYPKEYLDEIKSRLKVSTVVSKTVDLKKRGKEFVGLSPFKNEKTPSFTVNDEKEFYHCFATSEHGNIFDFIMKTQNLKFGEAVRYLANIAGMQPYMFSKQDEEREKKWKEYSMIYSRYVDYYHNELLKNETYSNARDYLKNRFLGKEIVKKFKIGFVDYNSTFIKKFKDEFKDSALLETGLFYVDDKKNKLVERFRNRIIFPINNLSGQPIALGGRIIEEKDYLAKYINSPETNFFKKGSNLYNLDLARKLSNKTESIYLVEGYMDVVGLNKNEIDNVVANLGTSLTDKQISTLNQFFDDIIICFDGDESGYKAALRAAENSIKDLQPDKQISFLFLPENEDPDSFVNKNGKNSFLDFSKNNKLFIHHFIFNHYKKQTNNDPSSLAIFEKNLKIIANSIKDSLIKKYVLEYFLEKISELTPHQSKIQNFKSQKKIQSLDSTKKFYKETNKMSGAELKELSIFYLIINNLSLIQENNHVLDEIKIFTDENKKIFNFITEKLKNEKKVTLEELNLDIQLIEKINHFASIKYILKNKIDKDYEIIEILEDLKRDLNNYDLELRIEELEAKFSKDFSEDTFNELKELKKRQNIN
ncbi:DNA primase [Candidatus Pelagibacter sp.]|uniref:DNA primase n=1 Tax=Candidatus Pelagibacter sp. TaxID=2024849 RepID=UPI003F856800